MACQSCDHTMQKIAEKPPTFWCPRCGSLNQDKGGTFHAYSEPWLIERCQKFAKANESFGWMGGSNWHRLGIAEAIRVESEAKEPAHAS